MKKVYSKKIGGEVFALAPEQLEVFRQAGYKTPTPEEVIADAGDAMVVPPENKRAYVVLNLKSGEFAVRVRACTLKGKESSALVGEIVQAGMVKSLVEKADPDRPKPEAPAEGAVAPLASIFTEALKKAIVGDTAAPTPAAATPSPIASIITEAVRKAVVGAAPSSPPDTAPTGAVKSEEVVDK